MIEQATISGIAHSAAGKLIKAGAIGDKAIVVLLFAWHSKHAH